MADSSVAFRISTQSIPFQLGVESFSVDFENSCGFAFVTFNQFQYLLDMGLFYNPEMLLPGLGCLPMPE